MSKTVRAGQTVVASGVLGAGQTVTAYSGRTGKPHGALIEVATRATNEGTVDLLAGPSQINLYGATGAELQVTGTLTNNGTINLSGGAYGAPHVGPVTGALLLDQGVVMNAGSIFIGAAPPGDRPNTIDGTAATLLDSGRLTNPGLLSIAGGGFAQGQSGLGGVLDLSSGGSLHNIGLLTISGGDRAPGGTLSDSGVLTNSGSLVVGGGSGQGGYLQVAATASLNNQGVLTLATASYGAGHAQVAGALTNTGTLTLQGSVGHYDYGGLGASLEVTGVLTNQNLLTVEGGYGYTTNGTSGDTFGNGATLTVAGVLINDRYLVVDAVSELGTPGVLIDAGSVVNAGTIVLNGSGYGYRPPPAATLNVTGSLTNSGAVTVGGDASSPGGYPGLGALLFDAGVLSNAGTISVLGAPGSSRYIAHGGTVIDTGQLTNSGFINLDAGPDGGGAAGMMSVTAGGTLTNSGTIGGVGTLLNQGEIMAQTGGDIAAASLINDRTIRLALGAVFFIGSAITADPTKTGLLELASGATLTLAGSVANTQTVAFAGSGETLALGDATAFAGILDGLNPSSILDFLSLDLTSATSTGTSLTLDVSNGETLDLALAAPLAAGTTLHLQSDQHGGTDLLLQAPTPGT